jgi:prepilin-type N-terminal cleavage/methylation domain-containing protein
MKDMNKKTNPVCEQLGFSLLEVLMALAILSIGLLAIASQQITATQSNTVSSKLTEGTTHAQDKLEELVNLEYSDDDIKDLDGDGCNGLNDTGFDNDAGTPGDADYQENPALAEQRGYRVFWNVCIDPTTNAKRIRVISQYGIFAAGGGRTTTLNTVKPDI